MGRYGGIQERLEKLGWRDELQVKRNRIGKGKCLDSRNEQLEINIFKIKYKLKAKPSRAQRLT